jgi:hypothetical protein
MKGFIFGGFTPVSWDSSGQWKADNTRKSFLFTLTNPRNSEAHKFLISDTFSEIQCDSRYGPGFWSSHNIYGSDHCNTSISQYTTLGGSHVNDTGIDGTQVFTGECLVTVKDIEVFQFNL